MADCERPKSGRPDVLFMGLRSVGSGQGGVESHVDQLAHELDRLGYQLEIVVRTVYAGRESSTRDQRTKITPLWSFKQTSLETIAHSFLALAFAAVRRPRLLHVHAIGPSLVVPFARLLGLRVIITHHGEDFRREKWGWFARSMLRLGEAAGARFANQRICVSSSLSAKLSEVYGRAFNYIPNGVRLGGAVSSDDTLARFGLVRGGYILTVSRLVPEKRHLDLIAAFRELDRPDLRLVIVGAADHGSEYSRLLEERAAATPGVILTGFQTGIALSELFSHCAVFALPSSHEGLPIALLEALSYGRHVVASDITANLDLHLPNDCYFKLGVIEELAARLRNALAAYEKANGIDWSARLTEYTWPDVAAKTAAVYSKAGLLPHP